MKKFRIIVHCTNLNVPEEESGKIIIGFYATRYGRGQSIEEAFEKVKRNLENEDDFKKSSKITKQRSQLQPILEIEEFEVVPFYSDLFFKGKGYTFYPAE
ncbi:MAG: hypothetical protein KKC76_16045 [Proteobacteria bacterium]|nr:hypothetical protein [Pseudomonadota bacterium]MBU4296302.1 hypothetical protein [Pseudomonadota bacterium]MCG2746497.1 hypothetical protein [Desulfobulbaceae bacterium]